MPIVLAFIAGVIAMFYWNQQELPVPQKGMSVKTLYDLTTLRLDDMEKDILHIRKCACRDGLNN